MDAFQGPAEMPPLLGIFNDIPAHKMRDDEVMGWARAGFSFVVNDGEHSQLGGRMGRIENAMVQRHGLTCVQRLHREALSEHGDSLAIGARATMRPYGITVEDTARYLRTLNFPSGEGGLATAHDRGAFPVRLGDRTMCFTPRSLRAAETETQAWVQFETAEYILNTEIRDKILDLMAAQGRNKAVGFVGPFDAIVRSGFNELDLEGLLDAATSRGITMGRVCGSGTLTDPKGIEDAMVSAIQQGIRLISVHYMTSDLPFKGAEAASAPFFKACARCGF